MLKKQTYINPICEGADPFILLYNNKYYLYATNAPREGYKVFESDDLAEWIDRGFCLKKGDVKGEVIQGEAFELGFWAPEVIYLNGKFYMIYSVDFHIAVAVSDNPLGPFKQEEKKWLMEEPAFDGSLFIDDDGTVYVFYRKITGEKLGIAGAKLNKDMCTIDESSKKLLIKVKEFEWENGIEGPFMLKHNGKYYLSYSGDDYRSINYAVGYAISDSPLGEYKKYEANPILKRTDKVQGTGHHSFTTSKDGKKLICVYHCHNSLEKVHPRMTCVDIAEFVSADDEDDILVIHGPTCEEMPIL